ncbi:MAG TPA: hypothetical protein VIP05_19575 [Burkholderiaceae bacterium]
MRPPLLITLAAAGLLPCMAAVAQGAHSGPGAMRCTVVIGRLSSADTGHRMPVLAWAQGYLSGLAAARADAAPADVPEYDALSPRILALCKADPTSDLAHVARRILPPLSRVASRD